MAEKLHQRIQETDASDNVEMMAEFRIGRCHPLSQNRKGQFAVDLVHPYRLVSEKSDDVIEVAKIIDYH